MMAVPTIHITNTNVKNKNNSNSYSQSDFMLEYATKYVANNIKVEGLIEVIRQSGNPDLALQLLSGQYRAPNLHKSVKFEDGKICTLQGYNPWETQVSYAYTRQKTKSIYVIKSTIESGIEINEENYQFYAESWSSSKDLKSVDVLLSQTEEVWDTCYLSKWMDSEVVIEAKQEFSREIYTLD